LSGRCDQCEAEQLRCLASTWCSGCLIGPTLGLDDDQVSLRYRDYRDGQHKTLTLEAPEFIRRFLLHVLPKGLMLRVRRYGLLANRCRGNAWRRSAKSSPRHRQSPRLMQSKATSPSRAGPARCVGAGACARCARSRRAGRRWAAHPIADRPPTAGTLSLPTECARAQPLPPHSAEPALEPRSCKRRNFGYNRAKPAPEWRPEESG